MKPLIGRVTNIQEYCVHDGPGIRTVIFLKGCPLRCAWCANPETQSKEQELAYSPAKCIGCKRCIQQCAQGAIRPIAGEKVEIVRAACNLCTQCVATCYAKALHIFGEDYTVEQLFQRTHRGYAWRSNGGITISGGEPLEQAEFVAALLARYRAIGTHTCVETTGFAAWECLEKVAARCNLVFYDLKGMDRDTHVRNTGQDNQLILKNLRALSERFPEVDLIVRTPVIPGVNDDEASLTAIRDFLATLPHLTDYELLPYHGFGAPKYAQLGRDYPMDGQDSMEKEAVARMNLEIRKSLHMPR